jgi:heavy metal translocating P-type ATPase
MTSERATRWMLIVTAVGLALGGVLWLTGQTTASNVCFVLVAVIPVVPLIGETVNKLRRRQPGVDVIALLAVVAALALGEYLTAAIIGLMLATGRFLDEFAAGRAERELTALVRRAPRTANRVRDGQIEIVDVNSVGRGDRLLIKSGEVIPVDGVILSDTALVDEAALTGEPLPTERMGGDLVSSGAVNAADMFEIQATADAEHSTYAGIIRLVQEARETRAPSVRLADRWAGWFVPLALGVSGLAWAVSGDPVRGLAVLVVATPCPLLLAVPIAVVSGISRGARRGIIFRGGGSLETLAQTRNVLIDKTGTVTVGQPALRSIVTFAGGWAQDEALRLAASVDQTSTHVLARAIVDAARHRHLHLAMPSDVSEAAGSGVTAKVDGRSVAVGRLEWLLDGEPEPAEVADFRRRMLRVAPLAVFVSIDGELAAALVFDDTIRPDAANTIRALRRTGVERIVMATGDNAVVGRSVGMAIGVDEVLAECTPGEKVEAVEELRIHGVTTMVGDGINDAPALAAADVGVAMGARGATASSEAADVVLMVDQLQRLVDAIGIAQRSRTIAVQSVVIGMGLSVGAMAFAAFGLLAPIVGALVQEVIDVIAITNALRALVGKAPSQSGPKLSPELSRRLRTEHDELMPKLDSLRDTADSLDDLSPSEARDALEGVRGLLVDEILPHEAEDEKVIYPQVAVLLGGEDPMALMSRTHREIFHLVDVYQRQLSDLPPLGPEPADIRDLRRILYSLHAILRLHFDQEEELYFTLQDA